MSLAFIAEDGVVVSVMIYEKYAAILLSNKQDDLQPQKALLTGGEKQCQPHHHVTTLYHFDVFCGVILFKVEV